MRVMALRKLAVAAGVIGLLAAAVLVASAGASAGSRPSRSLGAQRRSRVSSTPTSYGVDIQAVYDAHGNPALVANFSPDGGLATPRWSVCSPPNVTVCTPARPSADRGFEPGATPAGTIFQATATYKGHTYAARSAPWQGTVRAIVPPRLDGHPRYRARVTAHGASWTGGWKTDPTFTPQDGNDSGGRGPNFDYLRVQACRTRDGRRCVTVSAPGEGFGFARRPPVVSNSFTGWYLFAFDERFAHDTAFAEPGYGSPSAVPPLQAGATVARSAPLGPVIGPAIGHRRHHVRPRRSRLS